MKTQQKVSCLKKINNMNGYSQSKEGTNVSPFIVEISQPRCFSLVKEWLEASNFEEIEPNPDYFEIFAKQNGFEFTFTISEEDHKALVNVSVYGKFGKTNKILRNTLKNMISYFSKK